jgi:hypothetical protein
MRRSPPSRPRILILVALLALAVAAPVAPAHAAPAPGSAFPPGSRPYGKTYAEWNTLWWQWFFRVPVHLDPDHPDRGLLNPSFEATGATCAAGQPGGAVFFLGFADPSLPSLTRRCTVPAGKALLLPLLNGLNLAPGGGAAVVRAAQDGLDEAHAALLADLELGAEIDGVAVPDVEVYLIAARGVRPFGLRLVRDSPFPPPGSRPGQTYYAAVGSGVYLLIAPLSVGTHVLRYGDRSAADPSARHERTYILTVAPTVH